MVFIMMKIMNQEYRRKIRPPQLSKTVPTTKVNGTRKPIKDMVEDIKCGPMVVSMMDIGRMIRQMDAED